MMNNKGNWTLMMIWKKNSVSHERLHQVICLLLMLRMPPLPPQVQRDLCLMLQSVKKEHHQPKTLLQKCAKLSKLRNHDDFFIAVWDLNKAFIYAHFFRILIMFTDICKFILHWDDFHVFSL